MEANLFLSDGYYKETAVSLKLKPLEELARIGSTTNKPDKKTEGIKYFEIENPVPQATILDIIYPLVQLGITKAKVYAVEVSSQAVNRWILEIPLLTQELWEKLKEHFISAEEIGEKEKHPILIEEDDYVIIKQDEKNDVADLTSSQYSYDMMSSSMLKSSFVQFFSSKLKSVNLLKRMDDKTEDPPAGNFCPAIAKDQSYKNSFNISNESIAYAPKVSLSSFEAANRLAAEFQLVGNQVVIKDIEEMVKLPEPNLNTM